MHRYALAIDTADWEALRDVFVADASVDFGSVDRYVEGDTGVKGIEAIVTWFRTCSRRSRTSCTSQSNHVIDLDGDRARVRTYARAAHEHGRRLPRGQRPDALGLAYPPAAARGTVVRRSGRAAART